MKNKKDWNSYSDEELLNLLVKLGEELAPKGYTENGKYKRYKKITPIEPTAKDLKKAEDYPPMSVYVQRFGNWSTAKYLAGFTESFENPYAYSKDELIDSLAAETGFSKEFASQLLSGIKKEKRKK